MFETFVGPDAVAHKPETGRVTELLEENKKEVSKSKEL